MQSDAAPQQERSQGTLRMCSQGRLVNDRLYYFLELGDLHNRSGSYLHKWPGPRLSCREELARRTYTHAHRQANLSPFYCSMCCDRKTEKNCCTCHLILSNAYILVFKYFTVIFDLFSVLRHFILLQRYEILLFTGNHFVKSHLKKNS